MLAKAATWSCQKKITQILAKPALGSLSQAPELCVAQSTGACCEPSHRFLAAVPLKLLGISGKPSTVAQVIWALGSLLRIGLERSASCQALSLLSISGFQTAFRASGHRRQSFDATAAPLFSSRSPVNRDRGRYRATQKCRRADVLAGTVLAKAATWSCQKEITQILAKPALGSLSQAPELCMAQSTGNAAHLPIGALRMSTSVGRAETIRQAKLC